METKQLLESIGFTNYSRILLGRMNLCFFGNYKNKRHFIKINLFDDSTKQIKAEMEALDYLKQKGLNVPEIVSCGPNYIILEYIKKNNFISKELEIKIIYSEMDKMHQIKSDNRLFGFYKNTFSGKFEVTNTWTNNWPEFFGKNRWKPLFDNILNEDINFKNNWVDCMKIYDILPLMFEGIKIEPVLLHGDINKNNYIITPEENIYFIDPSCYYGHDLYDKCCLDCWNNSKEPTNDPIKLLYYSYIYALASQIINNSFYLKKSINIIKQIIQMYSQKAVYSSLFYPLLINDNNNKPDCILLQGGSYNPVHFNHLNNMVISLKYVKSLGFKNILCIMALAPDERIKKKCKNGILLHHRLEMLKLAIKNFKTENIFIDITLLWRNELVNHYHNIFSDKIPLFICGGSDILIHQIDSFTLKDNLNFIIINRKDYENYKKEDNVIYLENEDETKMSSSLIRSFEKNKENHKNKLKKYLDADVLEYYLKI